MRDFSTMLFARCPPRRWPLTPLHATHCHSISILKKKKKKLNPAPNGALILLLVQRYLCANVALTSSLCSDWCSSKSCAQCSSSTLGNRALATVSAMPPPATTAQVRAPPLYTNIMLKKDTHKATFTTVRTSERCHAHTLLNARRGHFNARKVCAWDDDVQST